VTGSPTAIIESLPKVPASFVMDGHAARMKKNAELDVGN
jgi:hypothetical protein